MSKQSLEIGYSGKIPSLGDFVQQGLSNEFLDSWNEWLQATMAVSQEQIGLAWLDTYLTSPIWHFALSKGVCGDKAVSGTFMPSVDQVGRHYPFTLCHETQHAPIQLWQNQAWYQQAEEHVLEALEDKFDLKSWYEKAKEICVPKHTSLPLNINIEYGDKVKKGWFIQSEKIPELIALLHQSYQQNFKQYCLWWTQGSQQIPPCLLITEGLPQVSQFAAMLDGHWQRWNWNMSQIQQVDTNELKVEPAEAELNDIKETQDIES